MKKIQQAMSEYLLAPSHLEGLRIIKVRSPVSLGKKLSVYLEKDVEQKAIKVSLKTILIINKINKVIILFFKVLMK